MAGGSKMTSTYQTSEEGIKKIRTDLIRASPLEEIESAILSKPEEELTFEVLQESYRKALDARVGYLNKKYPEEHKKTNAQIKAEDHAAWVEAGYPDLGF